MLKGVGDEAAKSRVERDEVSHRAAGRARPSPTMPPGSPDPRFEVTQGRGDIWTCGEAWCTSPDFPQLRSENKQWVLKPYGHICGSMGHAGSGGVHLDRNSLLGRESCMNSLQCMWKGLECSVGNEITALWLQHTGGRWGCWKMGLEKASACC